MPYYLVVAFSLSILLPATIGCVKVFNGDTAYLPFNILMIAAFLAEGLSLIIVMNGQSNTAVYDLFSVTEIILIGFQFYRWSANHSRFWIFIIPTILFILAWLVINFLFNQHSFILNLYFNISYSAWIVLYSIGFSNEQIIKSTSSILCNSKFMICTGLIIFFTYSAIVESFWLYGIDSNGIFASKVYDVMSVINLIANLIFTVAILWIPPKQKFILQSS